VAHKALGDEYVLQINRLRELVGAALNYPNIQQVCVFQFLKQFEERIVCKLQRRFWFLLVVDT